MSRLSILLGMMLGLSFFVPRSEAGMIAYWNFDSGFNSAVGGSAFNLTAVNGATAGTGGCRTFWKRVVQSVVFSICLHGRTRIDR